MRLNCDESGYPSRRRLPRPESTDSPLVLTIGMLLIAVMLLTPLFSVLQSPLQGEPLENAARTVASPNYPRFFGTPPADGFYADADELFANANKVYDLDNNMINVTWNWGDGTSYDYNTTPPAATSQWVNQTHIYSPPGEPGMGNYFVNYTLNITLDDGTGNYFWRDVIVHVYIPDNFVPEVRIEELSGAFDPSDPVPISASARDLEGEALTWTYVYNDTVTDVFTEVFETPASAPDEVVWQNTSHVFGVQGTYYVSVHVTDRVGANQNDPFHNVTGGPITVLVVLNSIPVVTDFIASSIPSPIVVDAFAGHVNVAFTIAARDRDGDVLNVTWDFDDGTPQVYNESAGGISVYEFVQWRNYMVTGLFNITVNVTDGRVDHHVVRYLIVNVSLVVTLHLAPGWNFVSVPLVNHRYNASTLPGLLTGDSVHGYDPVTGLYTLNYTRGLSPPSQDFAIMSSTGYWIMAYSSRTMVLVGDIPSAAQDRNIDVKSTGGWAIVGFCSFNTTRWASSISYEMYGSTGFINVVAAYNPFTGKYQAYVRGVTSTDFLLVPGQAYWVYATADGTLAYDP